MDSVDLGRLRRTHAAGVVMAGNPFAAPCTCPVCREHHPSQKEITMAELELTPARKRILRESVKYSTRVVTTNGVDVWSCECKAGPACDHVGLLKRMKLTDTARNVPVPAAPTQESGAASPTTPNRTKENTVRTTKSTKKLATTATAPTQPKLPIKVSPAAPAISGVTPRDAKGRIAAKPKAAQPAKPAAKLSTKPLTLVKTDVAKAAPKAAKPAAKPAPKVAKSNGRYGPFATDPRAVRGSGPKKVWRAVAKRLGAFKRVELVQLETCGHTKLARKDRVRVICPTC